jgi:hypothetical protein
MATVLMPSAARHIRREEAQEIRARQMTRNA